MSSRLHSIGALILGFLLGMVLGKQSGFLCTSLCLKMFHDTYSANSRVLFFSCCSYFFCFLIILILTYLYSEKDLVKQAKTLNSAANKLMQKHH